MSSRTEVEPTPWAWLAALTGLAVVLRAIGLDGGLWYDEIVTLHDSVRFPLWRIVTTYPNNNQHTLFSVLARLSIVSFGEHPWSLRLPAMVLGAATVPVLYVFARRVTNRVEALLASFLLATAYHHVWFSQNARGYTTMGLLAVLSSWLLLRGLRSGHTSDFVWYGVTAALSIYTHLTMGFVVLSHALLCLLPSSVTGVDTRRAWRQLLVGFTVAGTLTLALYIPLLSGMQQFFFERESHPEVATPAWAAIALLQGLRFGAAGWSGALVGAALIAAGLWSYVKQSVFVAGLFVLPGIVTVAGTIALHRPLLPRFLFFLAGFGVLIVARGALEVGRLFRRRSEHAYGFAAPHAPGAPVIGVVLVLAVSGASVPALVANYRYPKQDYDDALRFVEEKHAANESIVTVGATAVVYSGYYGRDFAVVKSLTDLERIRARGDRIWVLYTLDESIATEIPDVWQALSTDCAAAASFRGTIAHGDITVCTMPSVQMPHSSLSRGAR